MQQYVNWMHTTKGCGVGAVELGAGGWAGTGDLLQPLFDPRSPGCWGREILLIIVNIFHNW